jgi:hypothetical protein
LAFGFALESKTAWYSAAAGSASEIASAKARPADLPELVTHGVPAPDPVHPQVFFVLLAALTATSLWKADFSSEHRFVHSDVAVSSAAYFSSNMFFRPPPVR